MRAALAPTALPPDFHREALLAGGDAPPARAVDAALLLGLRLRRRPHGYGARSRRAAAGRTRLPGAASALEPAENNGRAFHVGLSLPHPEVHPEVPAHLQTSSPRVSPTDPFRDKIKH